MKKRKRRNKISVNISSVSQIFNLKQRSEILVFLALLVEREKQEGNLILIKSIKTRIAEDIGVSSATIDNVVKKLTEKKMIIRIDRTCYQINSKISI